MQVQAFVKFAIVEVGGVGFVGACFAADRPIPQWAVDRLDREHDGWTVLPSVCWVSPLGYYAARAWHPMNTVFKHGDLRQFPMGGDDPTFR